MSLDRFARLGQAMADVTERWPNSARVDNIGAQGDLARGYAWGWQDAHEALTDKRIDSLDAMDFGWEYAIHAAHYASEQRGHKLPVQDAFKLWLAGKTNCAAW